MAYAINGINIKDLETTDPTAKTVQLYGAFPAGERYKSFTGEVQNVEVKTIGENEYLAIKAVNGECLAEILVSTEPDKVYQPKDESDRKAQQERNRETLLKAMAALGIYNGRGELDDAKFEAAKGKVIAFAAKLKGWREHNGNEYPKMGYIFNGKASDLIPAGEPIWPRPAGLMPVAGGHVRNNVTVIDDDLPF